MLKCYHDYLVCLRCLGLFCNKNSERRKKKNLLCYIYEKTHIYNLIHDKLQRDMTNKWIQKEQVNSNTYIHTILFVIIILSTLHVIGKKPQYLQQRTHFCSSLNKFLHLIWHVYEVKLCFNFYGNAF